LDLSVDSGALSLKANGSVNKLTFSSPDDAWITSGPLAPVALHFFPARGAEAPRFEINGDSFDYNDGPSDAVGPISVEFDHLLGGYAMSKWGKLTVMMLTKKNGYLYLDNLRLQQHVSGLFFTGDGEALDLRPRVATFRNIHLHRQSHI
jgi:hypothetical protein